MLIKPWSEVQAPRHVFEEEIDGETPNLIPKVDIDYTSTEKVQFFVVVPETIRVITQSLPQRRKVGQITLKYPQLETTAPQDDEYDEDEQLYAAIMEKTLADKYKDLAIDIYRSDNTLSIEVPHITNIIATNVLAKQLVKQMSSQVETWLTLSPSSLNNNQTLNKLGSKNLPKEVEDIPNVKPPQFITGISASINSQLSLIDGRFISLVLDAEGQPGYEKLDNDSLIDASTVVVRLLDISDVRYLKDVSVRVRKKNSYSNSMMYI